MEDIHRYRYENEKQNTLTHSLRRCDGERERETTKNVVKYQGWFYDRHPNDADSIDLTDKWTALCVMCMVSSGTIQYNAMIMVNKSRKNEDNFF